MDSLIERIVAKGTPTVSARYDSSRQAPRKTPGGASNVRIAEGDEHGGWKVLARTSNQWNGRRKPTPSQYVWIVQCTECGARKVAATSAFRRLEPCAHPAVDQVRRFEHDKVCQAIVVAHREEHGVGALMGFAEIGEHLGVTMQRAEQIATSALRKLKNNPEALDAFRNLRTEERGDRWVYPSTPEPGEWREVSEAAEAFANERGFALRDGFFVRRGE